MSNLVWIIVAAVILFKVISVIASIVGVYKVTKRGWQKASDTFSKNNANNDRRINIRNKPPKLSPYQGETPEQFFERIRQEEKKESGLKLNQKHKLKKRESQPEPLSDSFQDFSSNIEISHPETKKREPVQKTKTPKIDFKDKSTLRKAIIINEVLGAPKAYEL